MLDKNKSEKQFLEAFDKYSDDIFRYCYYRVFDRDRAKDLAQETYCRTWKYIIDGHKVENIRAFLYKTAKNMIIDDSRKKKSVSLDQMTERGFAPSITQPEKSEEYFMGQEILKIVQSLDEKYRDVIIMRYINDLSIKEISLILGETENNIYVRVSRGFTKVKEIFLKDQSKGLGVRDSNRIN